jgi:mono/diheme cytochrome c family protein
MRLFIAIAGLAVIAASGAAHADETGEALYLKKCAACHQPNGQGLPNPIPPLKGSGYLQADPSETATLILRGKAGMPAFHMFLSDEQISKILTYARSAWGNEASPVTTEAVTEARKALGGDGFKMPSN